MFSKLMSQASQFAMEGVKNLVVKRHVRTRSYHACTSIGIWIYKKSVAAIHVHVHVVLKKCYMICIELSLRMSAGDSAFVVEFTGYQGGWRSHGAEGIARDWQVPVLRPKTAASIRQVRLPRVTCTNRQFA